MQFLMIKKKDCDLINKRFELVKKKGGGGGGSKLL